MATTSRRTGESIYLPLALPQHQSLPGGRPSCHRAMAALFFTIAMVTPRITTSITMPYHQSTTQIFPRVCLIFLRLITLPLLSPLLVQGLRTFPRGSARPPCGCPGTWSRHSPLACTTSRPTPPSASGSSRRFSSTPPSRRSTTSSRLPPLFPTAAACASLDS